MSIIMLEVLHIVLQKKYNISRSTIRNWIELYKKNKTISKEEMR